MPSTPSTVTVRSKRGGTGSHSSRYAESIGTTYAPDHSSSHKKTSKCSGDKELGQGENTPRQCFVSSPIKLVRTEERVTPTKNRVFGEEIDANNLALDGEVHNNYNNSSFEGSIPHNPMNSSFLSLESKDTALSSITHECDNASITGFDDCASEGGSSVAMLRGWLDEFGKQHKKHYEKSNHSTHSGDNSQGKITKTDPVPRPAITSTPLPSANLLVKRIVAGDPSCPTKTPVASNMSRGSVVAKNLVKPGVDSTHHHKVPRPGCSATPVRIKPKIDRTEVEATNDGYASVKKLSAWLADDPTRNKKQVKQLRRGANVIAKSRKFDKGLENIIVEDHHLHGHVSKKLSALKNAEIAEVASLSDFERATQWPDLSTSRGDAATSVSVTDKRKWLAGAFKKSDEAAASMTNGTSNLFPPKAKTDIVTTRDARDDLNKRAKQLWRSKRTVTAETNNNPEPAAIAQEQDSTISSITQEEHTARLLSVEEMDDGTIQGTHKSLGLGRANESKCNTENDARNGCTTSSSESKCNTESDAPNGCTATSSESKCNTENDAPNGCTITSSGKEEETNGTPVGFHAARDLLVQRSKVNGNSVEVLSKVKLRKAKFEQLEKDLRRKSNPKGLLRTSWAEEEGGPSNAYVKKYVEDVAPPKSIRELP